MLRIFAGSRRLTASHRFQSSAGSITSICPTLVLSRHTGCEHGAEPLRVGLRSLGANTVSHLSAMPPCNTALSGTIADVFQDPNATS